MSWGKVIIASVVMIGTVASAGTRRSFLRVALNDPAADVAKLRADGFDVVVVSPDKSWADVIATKEAYGFDVLEREELSPSCRSRITPPISRLMGTPGEMVLYPLGCDGKRSPREDALETIGKELAAKIPSDSGRGTYRPGTSWELLYAVDGGDIDWMYHELHTLPYVIEVTSGFGSNGFQPPFSRRKPTVEALRGGWQYLLDRLDGPGIRGRVTDAQGRPMAGVTVTIGGLNYETGADGSYHALLAPGSYRVEFKAGTAEEAAAVLVKDRRKALSVRL